MLNLSCLESTQLEADLEVIHNQFSIATELVNLELSAHNHDHFYLNVIHIKLNIDLQPSCLYLHAITTTNSINQKNSYPKLFPANVLYENVSKKI